MQATKQTWPAAPASFFPPFAPASGNGSQQTLGMAHIFPAHWIDIEPPISPLDDPLPPLDELLAPLDPPPLLDELLLPPLDDPLLLLDELPPLEELPPLLEEPLPPLEEPAPLEELLPPGGLPAEELLPPLEELLLPEPSPLPLLLPELIVLPELLSLEQLFAAMATAPIDATNMSFSIFIEDNLHPKRAILPCSTLASLRVLAIHPQLSSPHWVAARINPPGSLFLSHSDARATPTMRREDRRGQVRK